MFFVKDEHRKTITLSAMSEFDNFDLDNSYSIFHILAIKTNYHQQENFQRIEDKIEKNPIYPIIGFDCKDMK